VKYARLVVGYHGCDRSVAEKILRGEERFVASENKYDWLGKGVYFWEHGADRAFRFAEDQVKRGRVREPTVIGALIQLGLCFDLLDTQFTKEVRTAYPLLRKAWRAEGREIPKNLGGPDKKKRFLDCAVLNSYLETLGEREGIRYQTVRGAFREGAPVFRTSCIYLETHIQIAVRDPACIVGTFRPGLGGDD
jgi:hypothetical protein